ncbi:3-alpha-(or 20-beta)-hydroxysteroid dehydrogenase [Lasiodiplodia theobromae]|uniref:Chanoclavine-I dehydrogenase n=1 Tax=Lasiodiplodia theobromae TaxID=45133 RepID=A0A5N5CV31_9PEZI|nr:3-alpha-(or 20-beta)-hydroxysteroid dehydrogenase [Lasiodiplodia theobromae]KAB2569206.1 Chanoclavine-I dehydrogenase [Lasiodiplodia theobromae]KAF4536403.1 3-alpha-(or 20-beta)-hydroxysteroid dehydrogenase [Lasiodiplodia theobromae]
MASLQGKVIAITGAASGIGLAVATLVASQGARVSLADVREKHLEEAADKIRSTGAQVFSRVVDVRKPEQVDAWIEATVATFGRLDGAANIAGVAPTTPLEVKDLDDESWKVTPRQFFGRKAQD